MHLRFFATTQFSFCPRRTQHRKYKTQENFQTTTVFQEQFQMPAPVQVAWKAITAPSIGNNNYQKFEPREEILPKGWNGYNSLPLPEEIHVTHDLGIKVRDGCTLYCDVYRPVGTKPVSAILAWSPYGKKYNGIT